MREGAEYVSESGGEERVTRRDSEWGGGEGYGGREMDGAGGRLLFFPLLQGISDVVNDIEIGLQDTPQDKSGRSPAPPRPPGLLDILPEDLVAKVLLTTGCFPLLKVSLVSTMLLNCLN